MFLIHFRLTLRQLFKEKLYPIVNIFGLSLGLCCFTVLVTILQFELNYDKHHENHNQIYRIVSKFSSGFARTAEGLGPLLLQDFPQLGEYVRFRQATQDFLQSEQQSAFWSRMYLADDSVFDVFTHDVIYGDIETAFEDPFSIAISRTVSNFYFGDSNPIGEVLSTGTLDYSVSLVFEPLPENTHLQYDILVPFKLLFAINLNRADRFIDGLWSVDTYTYLHVPPEFDVNEFDTISDIFYETYMAEGGEQLGSDFATELQPLTSVHYGEKLNSDQPTGNIFYLYGYSAVAVLVLVVAIFNYVALSIARSVGRRREIGIRKILGSSKRQLAVQYLGESLILSIFAALIGMVLAELLLKISPLSDSLSIRNLVDTYFSLESLGVFLALGGMVGLVAGAYPAFYMARAPLNSSLGGVYASGGKRFNLGKVLLIAQVTTSIAVIGAALAMQSQLQFLFTKPLGFERNDRVTLEARGADVIENISTIRDELIAAGYISDLSITQMQPGTGRYLTNSPVENEDGVMVPTNFARILVGESYVNTLGIEVTNGVDFSSDRVSNIDDTVMVNQLMARRMGWTEPLGKEIQLDGSVRRVIGVTVDFNYESLHNAVGPLILQPIEDDFANIPEPARPRFRRNVIISLIGSSTSESLAAIERTIRQFDPDYIFDPQFLETNLSQLYESEIRLRNLVGVFAFVCMLVSMMGVFGQAALASERRRKEMGIRKVLGASWLQIIALLWRQFLPLYCGSAILASVSGIYLLSLWISNFAYHEGVSIYSFLAAAVLVGLVASVTIVLQSVRTSLMDPVDTLRYE